MIVKVVSVLHAYGIFRNLKQDEQYFKQESNQFKKKLFKLKNFHTNKKTKFYHTLPLQEDGNTRAKLDVISSYKKLIIH